MPVHSDQTVADAHEVIAGDEAFDLDRGDVKFTV